jgi:hypothetical protein
MFPKKGKFFPGGPRGPRNRLDYVSAVAAGLRRQLGDTHQAVKTVMKWTGANERTVKNWLAGRYGPNGEHLICLFRHSSEVLDASLRLAGRDEGIAVREIGAIRKTLASTLLKIDSLMSERGHSR